MIDLFAAAAKRDEELARVLDNAQPWSDRAAAEIKKLKNWTGTAEDLRHALRLIVGEPHHHNAWGGLIMGAVKRRDLIKTGEHRNMKDAKSHARKTPVYSTVGAGRDYTAAGRRAYEARADHKNWPKWEDHDESVKDVWRRVAKAVIDGE